MAEPAGPLDGIRVVDAATLAAGPLVATAMGEFGADVIKVEQPGAGDPLRTWGDRKDQIGLVWKSMGRNKRCVTLDLRQPDGQDLFHRLLDESDVLVINNRPTRLGPVGGRLRGGPPSPPAAGHAPHHRLRAGWTQERPARLRHAGRGHERLRPPDRATRWSADPAAVHAGRRGGRPGRHLRGDDGPLPPGRARGRRPTGGRQPHRAPGPAHRVLHPGLRSTGQRSPGGWATASMPAPRATSTGPRTTSGWPSPAPRRTSPPGCTGPSTVPIWPTIPTTSTRSPARGGPPKSTDWWPIGSGSNPRRSHGRVRGRRGGGGGGLRRRAVAG